MSILYARMIIKHLPKRKLFPRFALRGRQAGLAPLVLYRRAHASDDYDPSSKLFGKNNA